MQVTGIKTGVQNLSISATTARDTHEMLDEDEEIEEDIIVGDADDIDLGEEDEDIDIVDAGASCDDETNRFDATISSLQDVLLDPEFEELREHFCQENCSHFEDSEENKLIYMDIFQKYTELIETNIERRLKAAIPGFDMSSFLAMLEARKDELMSDVFDLLVSFGDFDSFKELMLAYKREISGGNAFEIHVSAMKIHTEEQEDGDVRPDLDFGLNICSAARRR